VTSCSPPRGRCESPRAALGGLRRSPGLVLATPGEIAAACVAGVLDLHSGARVVVAAQPADRAVAVRRGAMASGRVRREGAGRPGDDGEVSIAAVNGPAATDAPGRRSGSPPWCDECLDQDVRAKLIPRSITPPTPRRSTRYAASSWPSGRSDAGGARFSSPGAGGSSTVHLADADTGSATPRAGRVRPAVEALGGAARLLRQISITRSSPGRRTRSSRPARRRGGQLGGRGHGGLAGSCARWARCACAAGDARRSPLMALLFGLSAVRAHLRLRHALLVASPDLDQ